MPDIPRPLATPVNATGCAAPMAVAVVAARIGTRWFRPSACNGHGRRGRRLPAQHGRLRLARSRLYIVPTYGNPMATTMTVR